jgi:hypothetical protein
MIVFHPFIGVPEKTIFARMLVYNLGCFVLWFLWIADFCHDNTEKCCSADLPPIGFCNEFLLGSERCAQFGFVFFLLFNFSSKQLRSNRKKSKNRQKTE